jgi:hypothetical protein
MPPVAEALKGYYTWFLNGPRSLRAGATIIRSMAKVGYESQPVCTFATISYNVNKSLRSGFEVFLPNLRKSQKEGNL